MSDAKTVFFSTLLGGVIALAGVFATSWLNTASELRTEKREKLEQIVEEALKLQACTASLIEDAESSCADNNQGEFRLVTLAYLYFPELKPITGKYSSAYLKFRRDISRCDTASDGEDGGRKQIACLDQVTSGSKLPEALQELATAIEKIARTLE